jgi:hypothetical protein
MEDRQLDKIEKIASDLIEYLRIKEREYLERNILDDNHIVSGTMILGEMIQKGDISMDKALQIFPAIHYPYNDYTVTHIEKK